VLDGTLSEKVRSTEGIGLYYTSLAGLAKLRAASSGVGTISKMELKPRISNTCATLGERLQILRSPPAARKTPKPGGRDIGQTAAIHDQTDVACVEFLLDRFLELGRGVRIQKPAESQDRDVARFGAVNAE
jgi:hypothetical protein